LYIEFLIDDIVDVGSELEIDIPAGDGADIIDLALDDPIIGHTQCHSKREIILKGDDSALVFER